MKYSFKKLFLIIYLVLFIFTISYFFILGFNYWKPCITENKCCYGEFDNMVSCEPPSHVTIDGITYPVFPEEIEMYPWSEIIGVTVFSILLLIIPSLLFAIIVKLIMKICKKYKNNKCKT